MERKRHDFAERQRSATRVLGAGRASARTVTSIRVGCSAWLGIFVLHPRRNHVEKLRFSIKAELEVAKL